MLPSSGLYSQSKILQQFSHLLHVGGSSSDGQSAADPGLRVGVPAASLHGVRRQLPGQGLGEQRLEEGSHLLLVDVGHRRTSEGATSGRGRLARSRSGGRDTSGCQM